MISEANGSFEETFESGRVSLTADADIPVRRFFRFHLRQFGNDVGGTFETFDMSSYTQFSEVPVYMDNALSLYYCARIDYGYIRNDRVYVTFTDREQRQWTFSALLGDRLLAGSLSRASQAYDHLPFDVEELLPEDQAWYAAQDSVSEIETVSPQIVMSRMTDSKRSLQCLYYYKTRVLNFVLPSRLSLDDCLPSVKTCRTYKLAIGAMIQSKPEFSAEDVQYQSVLVSYLDACDIDASRTRMVRLREDPERVPRSIAGKGLFLGTAFVFRDLNDDDSWDPYHEPVLAYLGSRSLLFVRDGMDSPVYGNDASGMTFESPVIGMKEAPDSPGWHVYSDMAVHMSMPWRIVEKMTRDESDRLNLVLANQVSPQEGCYVYPADGSQVSCDSVFPVLMQ